MSTQTRTNDHEGVETLGADVRVPERTCAACRRREPSEKLVRWVQGAEGAVVPDLRGSAFGRGAWIHPRASCLARLGPALSRSFRGLVTTSPERALELLRSAADRRTSDLLGTARRQRKLALGSDATEDALGKGQARLVLVAQDARAAAETSGVRQAVAEGLGCAWGSKERIGQIVGRPEVGVLAILDDRLAAALFDAIALAHLHRVPLVSGRGRRTDVSTEVE